MTPTSLRAEDSVLKVRGSNDCGRGVEGTGFLYAADRLMTNAHVVAGVDDPEVEIDGESVDADVVYYNADLDVAVLDVETGSLPTLPFDTSAGPEDGVAILGYPQDGPYDVQVGRIRSEQRLRSPDIYGDGHRHPRGLLAAGAGPAGQLRRPDRDVGGRRRRGGLRRVGHRRRHRLRPHRRSGRGQRRRRAGSAPTRCRPATAPADPRPTTPSPASRRTWSA